MPLKYDPSRPIYIHVINKLRNSRIRELFAAMAAECLPVYAEHGAELHNCWQSAPGQGRGPETVEVWELKDFPAYTAFVAASHGDKADPRIEAWLRMRDEWVESYDAMLCMPHPASPTIAELKERGVKAKLVVHELVHTMSSKQGDYLDGLHKIWGPVSRAAGRTLLALLYSPWNNRCAINIFGVGGELDDLPLWAGNYGHDKDEFQVWMTMAHSLRDDYNDRFLVPAPFSTAR